MHDDGDFGLWSFILCHVVDCLGGLLIHVNSNRVSPLSVSFVFSSSLKAVSVFSLSICIFHSSREQAVVEARLARCPVQVRGLFGQRIRLLPGSFSHFSFYLTQSLVLSGLCGTVSSCDY